MGEKKRNLSGPTTDSYSCYVRVALPFIQLDLCEKHENAAKVSRPNPSST